MYIDDQKYNNISGNFNFKLIIFYNICNRVDILPNTYLKPLSLMLIGLALNYYYNSRLVILIFDKACRQLYSFFKGFKLKRRTLSKWNEVLLTEIISKNIGKLTNNCF